MKQKKILLVVGSLRNKSFNKQLALLALKNLNDSASAEILDYSQLPLFNQDLEFPVPNIVKEIRNKVIEADALWFFTPEYNGHIPGVLKNLLDWLSRPLEPGQFGPPITTLNKIVTISGVAGKSKAMGSMANLKNIVIAMQMKLIDIEKTGVSLLPKSFQTNELIISLEDESKLFTQSKKLLDIINNLK